MQAQVPLTVRMSSVVAVVAVMFLFLPGIKRRGKNISMTTSLQRCGEWQTDALAHDLNIDPKLHDL